MKRDFDNLQLILLSTTLLILVIINCSKTPTDAGITFPAWQGSYIGSAYGSTFSAGGSETFWYDETTKLWVTGSQPDSFITVHVQFQKYSSNGQLQYFNRSDVFNKCYRYDVTTGASSLILEGQAPSQVRFVDNNYALIASLHGVLMELDLAAGTFERYEYNDPGKDADTVVTTFDVSSKTGMAYASLSETGRIMFYQLYSWNFNTRSGYQRLTGGPLEDTDSMRSFRVLDVGMPGDYILQSTKSSSGKWRVSLGVGIGAADISGAKAISGMLGNNLYADWTIVEHITSF